MNKTELVEAVAQNAKLSKADTKKVVDALFDVITKSLKDGDPVQLIGFGTFKVTDRKARVGRNPSTGEEIQIPAARVPAFSAGQSLKDAVKKN